MSPTKGGRKKKGDEQEEEVWKWWVNSVFGRSVFYCVCFQLNLKLRLCYGYVATEPVGENYRPLAHACHCTTLSSEKGGQPQTLRQVEVA